MRVLILAAILITGIAGCTPVDDERLVGTYVAEYSYAREELDIKPNGTYVQRILIKGKAEELTHFGTWAYDRSAGRLALNNALLLDDNFGKLKPDYMTPVRGIWGLSVRSTPAGITLNWNDDLGVRFTKKS